MNIAYLPWLSLHFNVHSCCHFQYEKLFCLSFSALSWDWHQVKTSLILCAALSHSCHYFQSCVLSVLSLFQEEAELHSTGIQVESHMVTDFNIKRQVGCFIHSQMRWPQVVSSPTTSGKQVHRDLAVLVPLSLYPYLAKYLFFLANL